MTFSVFGEHILNNREICPHCYRRIRVIAEAPDDEYWEEHGYRTTNGWSTTTLRGITTDKTVDTADDGCDSYPGPVVDESDQTPIRRGGHRIICGACGRIDDEGDGDAKSTSKLKQDLDRICERLAEQEVLVDRDAAFSHLEHEAAKPERQHAQQEVLAEAVLVGCQTADVIPDPRTG